MRRDNERAAPKGGVLAVILLLMACASPSPMTHDLTGTFVVHDEYDRATGAACTGEGGYDDIREGTQVVVRDGEGAILATGSLGAGALRANDECEFPVSVAAIPDAEFYSIEVADRGDLAYSAAEMEQMDWTVAFTLGE